MTNNKVLGVNNFTELIVEEWGNTTNSFSVTVQALRMDINALGKKKHIEGATVLACIMRPHFGNKSMSIVETNKRENLDHTLCYITYNTALTVLTNFCTLLGDTSGEGDRYGVMEIKKITKILVTATDDGDILFVENLQTLRNTLQHLGDVLDETDPVMLMTVATNAHIVYETDRLVIDVREPDDEQLIFMDNLEIVPYNQLCWTVEMLLDGMKKED